MGSLEKLIYLDHQATTPVDPRVFVVMQPYFLTDYGNASSSQHAFGWSAQKAVEKARGQVAALIGAKNREIVFTSGATEGINWLFTALEQLAKTTPVHVITSNAEHAATIGSVERAQAHGIEVTILPVDHLGRVHVAQVREALKPHTQLISLIHANNEIGSLNPLAEIGHLTHERGIWLHADSCQAVGKVALNVDQLKVDFLSISAHKIYGPKGVGALYVRSENPRIRVPPLLVGGGQERGLRAGTLNVPGIVGLGAACELAMSEGEDEFRRLSELNQVLRAEFAAVGGVRFNGDPVERIPGNLSLTIDGVLSADLFPYLKNIAVSTGSACASQDARPSHVLLAIGLSESQARSTFRLGLGRGTTREECLQVVSQFALGVRKLRLNSNT